MSASDAFGGTPQFSSFQSLFPIALDYHRAGMIEAADEIYARLTSDLKNVAQVLHLRGIIAHNQGRFEQVTEYAAQAVALEPNQYEYANLLGSGRYHLGDHAGAIEAFRKAISLQPQAGDAYTNLCLALTASGDFAAAIEAGQRAIELLPESPGAQGNLGIAYVRDARHSDGIPHLERAVALNPTDPSMRRNLANAYKETGRFADARREYRETLRIDPTDGHSAWSLAQSQRFTASDRSQCESFEKTLQATKLLPRDRSSFHFAAGKIREDAGDYEQALTHYRHGNELIREKFDRRECRASVDRKSEYFTAEWFENHRGFGSESREPIFLVGMFRSGTTLAEQILASHPEIFGAGELMDIARVRHELPAFTEGGAYPECLNELSPMQSLGLANDYLNRRDQTERHFTDKMPKNFWNLGLIALLFPNAKIVHCVRNPLDLCFSNFATRFSDRPAYCSDFGDLAFYYRQYSRLMDHWKRVLPLPILEVRYEDLVADQHAQTRRLLEFVELPWNEACLAFHRHARPITTSSDWQVRQPLYDSSVGRASRFASHLADLTAELNRADD